MRPRSGGRGILFLCLSVLFISVCLSVFISGHIVPFIRYNALQSYCICNVNLSASHALCCCPLLILYIKELSKLQILNPIKVLISY
uniref:Uncharacterized protein n=1 Tax=Anguilla anguilla TaxID=7936 RepID=A0A0E9WRZ5_ANGAN